jgi:hypothetical protein
LASKTPFGQSTFSSSKRKGKKPLGVKTSVADIQKQNDKTIERLKSMTDGRDVATDAIDKMKNGSMAFIKRLGGTLNAPNVAVQSVIHNAISDDDVSVLGEVGKSLKGESEMSGARLLKDLGIKPQSAFGKFALGTAGLGIDIATDPLTYLSFGFSAITKEKAAIEAAKMFDGVLDADRAAELAKYVPEVADFGGQAVKDLDHASQAKLYKAVLRDTGAKLGDEGGIKAALGYTRNAAGEKVRMQPSLIKSQAISEGVDALKAATTDNLPQGVVDVIDSLKGSAANAASLVNPMPKMVMQDGKMGALARKAAADALKHGNNKAGYEATKLAGETFGHIDEDLRHVGTVAFQRTDDTVAERVDLLDKLEAMWKKRDEADKVLKAKSSGVRAKNNAAQWLLEYRRDEPKLRQRLTDIVSSNAFDPARFKAEVEKLAGAGSFTPAQLDEAATAFGKYGDEMRKLRVKDIADNIANKKLGDRGLYYVKGLDGEPNKNLVDLLRGEAVKQFDSTDSPDIAAQLQNEIQGLDTMRSGVGQGSFSAKRGSAYNKKEFDTIEQRLKAGVGAETDIMKIMKNRVEQSGKNAAHTDFMDTIARQFGEAVDEADPVRHFESTITDSSGQRYRLPEGVTEDVKRIERMFSSPEEIKMFSKNVGKLTQIWKSQATATPGFFMRNAQSNYFLASAHGMGDMEKWKDAWGIIRGTTDDAAKLTLGGKTYTVGELRALANEHGVLNGGQMSELFDESQNMSALRSMLSGGAKKGYAAKIHEANGIVENHGRMAVFLQALDRGSDEKLAAKMVDKVLYSYDKADLTGAEQAMKNVIPFYTWLRRNLPAQVEVMLKDPKRISVFAKAQNEGDEATDRTTAWNEMPKYMQDMGAIPIPLPNGKKAYINPNFGWQDLNKLEDLTSLAKGDFQPLNDDVLASFSPFIKTPAELAFDRDAFFGTPIKDFEGHKVNAPSYIQQLEKLLGGNKAWEGVKSASGAFTKDDGTVLADPETLKLLGMSPFLANADRLSAGGDKEAGRLLSFFLGVKPMADQSEQWHDNAVYEQQTRLQEILKMMKERGIEVPKTPRQKKAKAAKSPFKKQTVRGAFGG